MCLFDILTDMKIGFVILVAVVYPMTALTTVVPVETRIIDRGREIDAKGLRIVAGPSRWHSRTPYAVTVSAVSDATGTNGVRRLVAANHLPPCYAGESLFVEWPRTKSRYWRVDMTPGGKESVRRHGEYMNWAGFRVRAAWGWPHTGDANDKVPLEVARLELFDSEPDDIPRPGAKTARAYPESRLVKDWLLREFGPDAWHAHASAATNAAWLASQRLRRAARLAALRKHADHFVYIRRAYTIGGDAELHGTALVTDEPVTGRPINFRKGAQLCLLTLKPDGTLANEVLVEAPQGMIRDPDLSHDGRTLVFAMRTSFNENAYIKSRRNGMPTRERAFPYDFYTKLEGDDYHLYTLDLASRAVKQITFSDPARCADFEPCWTSDGKIVFQSSRCEQAIPCHQTMDVNLYTCDADGSHIRRLAIDGGCTSFPRELPDGRILYTRYEYNDRCARLQQPLFSMYPDGTGQTAFYGNASAFPASLIHFRPIPGTGMVLGILSGHHVHQQGKIVEVDPSKGLDGDAGITFVAGSDLEEKGAIVPSHYADNPKMVPFYVPDSIDFATQTGAQWQYPLPLGTNDFLVSFLPEGSLTIKNTPGPHFGVYWQDRDGDRELLAYDPAWECVQAIPVAARPKAFVRRRQPLDWSRATGTFHISDVYAGEGLKGVARGTVKRLRVVAVENRPTYTYSCAMPTPSDDCFKGLIAYSGDHSGEAVTAGGAWDVKHVFGEVDVAEDGSCTFTCPANNPVYFQMLDSRGRCVQTMRSWTYLQPGEVASCVGCHEDKKKAVPILKGAAARARVQTIRPAAGLPAHPLLKKLEEPGGLLSSTDAYLGVHAPCALEPDAPVAGFSYRRHVQPILDRHCVKCHDGTGEAAKRPNLTGAWAKDFRAPSHRKFTESYKALTRGGYQSAFCNWYSSTGRSAMLPPRAQGSSNSQVMDRFEPSHHGVQVTDDEKRVVACWIDLAIPFVGSYCEATDWTDDDRKVYDYHQRKRVLFAQREIDGIKSELKMD